MSREREISNLSAMGGADRGFFPGLAGRLRQNLSSSRSGIHNFVFSSSLTLAVCMTSSGYSLYTSTHVLQDSSEWIGMSFSLKLLFLCKSLLKDVVGTS